MANQLPGTPLLSPLTQWMEKTLWRQASMSAEFKIRESTPAQVTNWNYTLLVRVFPAYANTCLNNDISTKTIVTKKYLFEAVYNNVTSIRFSSFTQHLSTFEFAPFTLTTLLVCMSLAYSHLYHKPWIMQCSFYFVSDKPERPTLTSSVKDPLIGDSITLTCASTTQGVDRYQFYKDQTALTSTGTSNTFTISSARIETPVARYHCQAFIGSVVSEDSNELSLNGKCL